MAQATAHSASLILCPPTCASTLTLSTRPASSNGVLTNLIKSIDAPSSLVHVGSARSYPCDACDPVALARREPLRRRARLILKRSRQKSMCRVAAGCHLLRLQAVAG